MRALLGTAATTLRLGERLWQAGAATALRATGRMVDGPMPLDPRDKRFADPAWTGNAAFWGLRQAYLAWRDYGLDLVRTAGLDPGRAARAEVAWSLLLDAMAPTNFLAANPAVLKRAFDTGGLSLARGGRHAVDDLRHHGGRPRQVDPAAFTVGRDLACTPSKVVFRNDLIEVLQYLPQTEQVYGVPLLCSPPWINKYYIMDLAPGRSFIEWAVRHGRTVFAISYRNADPSMAGLTLDDYAADGLVAAIDVAGEITGSERVDVAGLCLGGTLAMMTAAHQRRIGTITVINAMVDFADPGVLGLFTGPAALARLEKRMRHDGFLAAGDMAAAFDLLRANDLIFTYVVSNWLMGEPPPAFDILAWNADSTRVPAALFSSCLRDLYIENNLAEGRLTLGGRPVDLDAVDQDLYVVSAVNDHIVPWPSAYATLRKVRSKARFVLSNGGHIAGIVNPPSARSWYVPEAPYPDGERRAGSWWEDWARWGAERAGALGEPPSVGSDRHPVLGDGPGDYVRG